MHDREFGLGFIKICSYFPYPAKVWINGHEWAKRQAGREGLSYAALANGFAACPEAGPAAGDLRPFRPVRRAGVLRPVDGAPRSAARLAPGRAQPAGATSPPAVSSRHDGLWVRMDPVHIVITVFPAV